MEPRRSRSKKRKKRFLKRILIFLFILLLLAGSAAAYVFYQTMKAANESYSELERGDKSGKREAAVEFGEDPVSLLLLGVEDYASGGKGGRADTIMVATFNPKLKTMKLLSIPRDTKVYIPYKDKKDKINHSYNKGVDATIETVEDFLDIPIDYYATVNFEGFKSIIDEIGGVEVNVPFDFWEYSDTSPRRKIEFKEGPAKLDGEEALAYARMRKQDKNGDFGRNDRQKEIVMSAIDSLISPKNILKIDDIAEHVGDNVQTNIKMSQGLSFVTSFTSFSSESIETLKLEGSNSNSSVYYYLPDEESVESIQAELKEHLEL